MPFFLIRGTYHIKGYAPDGDSIRFQARDKVNWAKLGGQPVAVNARGHAQLRLEAIDTLETHYKNQHQPPDLPIKALEFLLKGLGITRMKTDAMRSVVTSVQDGTEGYILARKTDKYQRPIAFVFAGVPPEKDGASVFLSPERLRQSVNYESLQAGMAYPTYYQGLFPDLRQACTGAAREARQAGRGVWPVDRTDLGFDVKGLESITEQHVILPKLFRRLVEYLEGGGSVDGFKEYLKALAEDVLIISTAHYTHFDTVVEVNGDTVRLTEPPENLMFVG